MDPEYFLYKMRLWEVHHYMNGIIRRSRPQWESARWLGWIVAKLLGEKQTEHPTDFMSFEWEQEDVDFDEMQAQTLKLIEECKEENERQRKAAHTSGS